MRAVLRLLSVALCLVPFCVPGCGVKSLPRAPEDVLPQVITDLACSDTPEGVRLSWSRPRLYADGKRMTDLGGFVIERADGTDPALPFRRLSVLEVSDRDRFRQIKAFHYVDPDAALAREYYYRVVSFTLDGYFSAPSNMVMAVHESTDKETHAPLSPP